MEPSTRQLTAVGVERHFAPDADPTLAGLEPRAGLTLWEEPERFEPRDREEREAVVELNGVDVVDGEVGPGPHHLGAIVGGCLGEVGALVPAVAAGERGTDRIDPHHLFQIRCCVGPGDDECARAVAWNVAVVQSERP